jgi:hypothetical protein
VKNLRWQFVHDAIAGTLPSYLKTTKRRSISNGDSVAGIEAVPHIIRNVASRELLLRQNSLP